MHRLLRVAPLLLTVLIPIESARADATPPTAPATPAISRTNEGLSLGMSVHRFQDDFAIGLTLSTPSIAARTLRITAAGGLAWYPYAQSGDEQSWKTYGHTRVVLEAGRRIGETPIRLYGFGGPTLLFIGNLSTDAVSAGGVGGFGFEFFPSKHGGSDGPVSYRIELGGIGTNARAEKQAGSPIFANGFLIGAAMHFYP